MNICMRPNETKRSRWLRRVYRGPGRRAENWKKSLSRGHLTPERRVKQSSTTIYTGKHKSFGLNVRFRITEMKRFINARILYIRGGYALFPFFIILLRVSLNNNNNTHTQAQRGNRIKNNQQYSRIDSVGLTPNSAWWFVSTFHIIWIKNNNNIMPYYFAFAI